MQSTWYRLPEDDEPQDATQIPRGGKSRGRGRGRGRGSGRTRQAKEPHGVATPYDMHTMGHNPPMNNAYAPHPFYYNTSGIEEIPAHWQYVTNHILQPPYNRNFSQTPIQAMPGYMGFPTRHNAQAGHGPYSQEHFDQFVNISPTHHIRPARASRNNFQQPSGNHHFTYIHPGYSRYENLTPKGQHRPADQCSAQNVHSPRASRPGTIRNQIPQELASSLSKNTKTQTPEVQVQTQDNKHRQQNSQITQTSELLKKSNTAATITIDPPQAQKTLAETAAFLSHPHLRFQNIQNLSSGYSTQPTQATCPALSQTPELLKHSNKKTKMKVDPAQQAHQRRTTEIMSHQNNPAAYLTNLMLSTEKVQDLSSKPAMHDLAIVPQTTDFRRYSELSVTTLPIEPPPAHQNYARTEKCLKHLDMTPPPAHQTPVSQVLALPQPGNMLPVNSLSPPQAHQATSISTVRHLNAGQSYELQPMCHQQTTKQCAQTIQSNSRMLEIANNTRPKRQQNKRKSNTSQTSEGVLSATHSVYHPHQMLGEAQIIYQPSTETFATEQLVYQPQIDMFTKEQMVYHPRTKMLAKTQVIYQPHTEFFATAEAVYQSDIVATRQTVVQPQTGMMKTAAAVYNTQENMMSTRQTMQHPRADMERTTEALYQQQADTLTAKQRKRQTDIGARNQYVYAEQTGVQAETNRLSSYKDKRQTKPLSSLNEKKLNNNKKVEGGHILRNILSHEQASDKTHETERNMATLQLLQENYNQVLPNTSYLEPPNQSLRQNRKRKISPTQPDWAVPAKWYSADESSNKKQPQQPSLSNITQVIGNTSARELVPTVTESTARNIQSAIALNWTLQSLERDTQLTMAHYVAIENLLKNCSNNSNTKHDDK